MFKNKLLKHTGIYTISNLVAAAIPFFLLPFLTVHLSPEAYAKVDIFYIFIQFLIPFIGLNSHSAIIRLYFDSKEKGDFSSYVYNSILITFLTTILTVFLVLLSIKSLENFLSLPYSWILYAIPTTFALNIAQIILAIWQTKNKSINFGLFRISRSLIEILISIILVGSYSMDWEGRTLGQFLSYMLFLIIAFYFIYKEVGIGKYNKIHFIEIVKYGTPLILHVLGAIIMTYSDRFFIKNMVDLKQVGYYSVGYQIGMIIYFLQNSFNQAWTPWLYSKLKSFNKEVKTQIEKYITYYFISIFFIAFFLWIITPFIFKIFISEQFQPSIQFVPWIVFGFAFNGMYKMFAGFLFFTKSTTTISFITLATALINIILNYFFINTFGAKGAAIASTVSFMFQFILTWLVSRKYYQINWLKIW
ncbi:MAG: oligosaccharide flippase family protein [Bacteroidales bacterium]|nr:oligosaccharide flippase family protein [Bacteroidales bacterium]